MPASSILERVRRLKVRWRHCAVPAVVAALAGPLAITAGAASPSPAPASVASPSAAAIDLSVTSGPPNTYVQIRGTGFPAGVLVEIYLDSPSVHLGFPGPRSDAEGNFQESDLIPGVSPGRHSICAAAPFPSEPPAAKACAPFAVTSLQSSVARAPSPSGVPFSAVALTVGAIVALAVGASVWSRRR